MTSLDSSKEDTNSIGIIGLQEKFFWHCYVWTDDENIKISFFDVTITTDPERPEIVALSANDLPSLPIDKNINVDFNIEANYILRQKDGTQFQKIGEIRAEITNKQDRTFKCKDGELFFETVKGQKRFFLKNVKLYVDRKNLDGFAK